MNKCSFVISTIYKVILFLVNLKVFFLLSSCKSRIFVTDSLVGVP